MNAPTGKKWYLVYSKPRQEILAKTNLVRQGYETYLPLFRQPRRRLGRRVTVTAPMFPRYLFIHLDDQTDNWGPIRSTVGVVSIVRFGHTPAPVPDDLIAMLQSREDERGIQVLPPDDYKPGNRVRITEGGLAGYEGIYLARTSRERVVILLEIMGKSARSSVDVSSIEPVG